MSERGAGTVLALAMIGVVTIVVVAMLSLGAALTVRQRVIGAADGAAIAAADAASGAIAGAPCDLAARVAIANGAALTGCELDGLIATVTVSAGFGAMPVSARSTAGPPP